MTKTLKQKRHYLAVERYQPPKSCSSKEQLDQIVCERCGFIWDKNDDKPECLTDYEVGQMYLKRIKDKVEKNNESNN